MDPDEAEDRRRRERIRANAALFGLPPLTPREFREVARNPVAQAKWRAVTPRKRAVMLVACIVGLLPLLAAALLIGSGQKHTGAVILVAWVLLCLAWPMVVLLTRALSARVRRSR